MFLECKLEHFTTMLGLWSEAARAKTRQGCKKQYSTMLSPLLKEGALATRGQTRS